MPVTLTSDQAFFRDTTARFLDDQLPVAELRRLRRDQRGFDRDYWWRGAELGWTSLLVAEAHGGGTISGQGIVDLALIAYEFGRHAAPGPLVPTNLVAAALSDAGGSHPEVLGGLVSGTVVATPCDDLAGGRDGTGLRIVDEGTGLVVEGTVRPVESAAESQYLLVTGQGAAGLRQLLVPADAPGVSIEPLRTVDLTRRFGAVTFDRVRIGAEAAVGERVADRAVERQRQMALAMLTAESVGAMQAGFELTVEWAMDRHTFGRPLASYQALKHRFADMKTWLEAGHAVSDAAAAALGTGSPATADLLAAAKAFVGHYGTELLQDCVQLHGGMGLTYEHDLHLYLRRHAVNRTLYGTPDAHRRRLGSSVLGDGEAA